MFLLLNEIKSIQIDHTSRCNLMCPQCARVTHTGAINPKLHQSDLTLENYKTIFTPFIGKNIGITHCGNFGDIIASPTFDITFNWCIENGFSNIRIMTNGSARSTQWWAELSKKNPYVIFSVDGLKDTNHLYRVNSNFDKIISNIRAFTGAGGRARWDYIVFEHNYHQVSEAKELAKSLGVEEFNVKNTTRFITETGYAPEILNKNYQVIEDSKDNKAIKDYNKIIESYGSFNKYVHNTTILCKYQQMKRMYIDFNMRLWPCCWVGGPYLFYSNNAQTIDINKILNKYDADFNRIDIHGWDAVLNHEFYSSYLEYTWANENDRIYTCGRTCGIKYEFSSGYGTNTETQKLK